MADSIVDSGDRTRFALRQAAGEPPANQQSLVVVSNNWPATLRATPTSRDMIAVRDATRETQRQLATITVGKAGFNANALGKVSKALDVLELRTGDTAGTLFGFGLLFGAIGGVACGLYYESWLVAGSVFGGAIATLEAPVLAAHGLHGLGSIGQKKRDAILIQHQEIEDVVARFDNAGGADKIALGNQLSTWLTELKAKRSIEPETGAELQRVVDALATLPDADRERVKQLETLLTVLADKKEVTGEVAESISTAIAAFPAAERADLAEAVFALLKDSGREQDYDAKHALFALAAKYKNAPSEEQAS